MALATSFLFSRYNILEITNYFVMINNNLKNINRRKLKHFNIIYHFQKNIK